jgi:hypothetical protein
VSKPTLGLRLRANRVGWCWLVGGRWPACHGCRVS